MIISNMDNFMKNLDKDSKVLVINGFVMINLE